MKKTNILKIFMTLVLAFAFTGVFAQPWSGQDPVSKYSQSTLTNDPATVVYTDKVTLGATMPFWVWPSAEYNPDFDPATDGWDANYPTVAQINTNVVSDFAWRTGADFAGLGAVAGFTTNYVEITFGALGNRLIEVIETPTSGICAADPVYFGVNVIAVPSASINNTGVAAYGLDNVIASGCWANANDLTTAVNVTLPNADEVYPYHVNVTYNVYNVDGLDGLGELPSATGASLDNTDPSVTTLGADGKILGQDGLAAPSASNPIIINAGTELVASQDYPVQGGKITVYEIVYNNVNATISRKSDYIAARTGTWAATDYGNFTYYPAVAAATANYIIAFPTPVTGPIYHISNTFSY